LRQTSYEFCFDIIFVSVAFVLSNGKLAQDVVTDTPTRWFLLRSPLPWPRGHL